MNRREFIQSFITLAAGLTVPAEATALANAYLTHVPEAGELTLCKLHVRNSRVDAFIPLGRPTQWRMGQDDLMVWFPSVAWTWDVAEICVVGMFGSRGQPMTITHGDALNVSARIEMTHLARVVDIAEQLRRWPDRRLV